MGFVEKSGVGWKSGEKFLGNVLPSSWWGFLQQLRRGDNDGLEGLFVTLILEASGTGNHGMCMVWCFESLVMVEESATLNFHS